MITIVGDLSCEHSTLDLSYHLAAINLTQQVHQGQMHSKLQPAFHSI